MFLKEFFFKKLILNIVSRRQQKHGKSSSYKELIILHIVSHAAPEGIDKPTITIVSESALRVSWMAPVTPNGKITGYNIYINDKKIETALVTPGSYVVDELLPYTVYIIQVCTWVY